MDELMRDVIEYNELLDRELNENNIIELGSDEDEKNQ